MINITEEQFLKDVKKVVSKRVHKIRNSYGVYDAYKYYRKNKPKDKKYIITESQYFKIIRTVNNILKEEFLEGKDIVFPNRMGKLQLYKNKTKVYKENGKIKTTYPIDWDKTLKLWYEDGDSYKNKLLVRNPVDEVFKVVYNKNTANYNNKSFFSFKINRDIKVKLKQKIKEGQMEAFIKYNNYE